MSLGGRRCRLAPVPLEGRGGRLEVVGAVGSEVVGAVGSEVAGAMGSEVVGAVREGAALRGEGAALQVVCVEPAEPRLLCPPRGPPPGRGSGPPLARLPPVPDLHSAPGH